jgi:hypothetical protein
MDRRENLKSGIFFQENMHKLFKTIKEEHEKPVEGQITGI